MDVAAKIGDRYIFWSGEIRKSVFVISNKDCPTEEALIRKRLGSVPGIGELLFNLMSCRLVVHHSLDDERPIQNALRGSSLNRAFPIHTTRLQSG